MMRVWKGHLYARLDEIMLMLGAELVFFAVGELMFTLVAKTQGLDGSVIPIIVRADGSGYNCGIYGNRSPAGSF